MCDFSTANHYKLKEHCRSHTREKIFACNTCGGMFASRTKLVDHLVRQNSSGCKCGIYLVYYYLINNRAWPTCQEAYLPKTSIVRQIVSEILAPFCSDNSIQLTQVKFRRICMESSEHSWANITETICPEMLIFGK